MWPNNPNPGFDPRFYTGFGPNNFFGAAPAPPPQHGHFPHEHHHQHVHRTSTGHLSPDMGHFGAGLHRSRSHGHGPRPQTEIINVNHIDVPPSPDLRGRVFIDDTSPLRLPSRSRSRSRGDARLYWELKRREEEDREAAIIADYKRKEAEKKQKEKEQEEALLAKIEKEKREKKEKEEKEWEAFLLKQKQQKEAEEKKKKEDEEKLQAQMRDRLNVHGLSSTLIGTLVEKEVKKKEEHLHIYNHTTTSTALVPGAPRNPVYPMIHRKYLEIDTLRYYQIPYEFDSRDPNYIIILMEMDKHSTEHLFEHTRRLRGKDRLLITEGKKEKKPALAIARRRDRSRSRSGGNGELYVVRA